MLLRSPGCYELCLALPFLSAFRPRNSRNEKRCLSAPSGEMSRCVYMLVFFRELESRVGPWMTSVGRPEVLLVEVYPESRPRRTDVSRATYAIAPRLAVPKHPLRLLAL